MQLHEDLPPFFGIIDLVLRNGNQHIVVDHKTGKAFYELDPIQLVFYREFVRLAYSAKKIDAYYDQYRWVKNLDLIKKPAFKRSKVPIRTNALSKAITRARKAYAGMCNTTNPVNNAFSETCFQCQFRDLC
jgi:CRISPR/Cas system-associated exonuclease Cas4 (RecB family)